MEQNKTIPNYTREDVIEMPQSMEAAITEIRLLTGKDIFVNKEGVVKTDEPEKEFVVIYVENTENNYKSSFHMVKYDARKVPDNSNLGKFLNRYGKLETSLKVVLLKNQKGYYDLAF